MTNKRYAVLFTSKNTYGLFEPIFFDKSCDLSEVLILNIDVGSTAVQLKLRDELSEKHGIINISPQNDPHFKSTERCIDIAAAYLATVHPQIKWIFHAQNDGFFRKNQAFFGRFGQYLEAHPEFEDRVGQIGFRVDNILDLKTPCHGRGCLVQGVFNAPYPGHYAVLPEAYLKEDYSIVESPCFTISAINLKLWREHIKPDPKFIVYYWGDDVAHQFLLKGIPTICIPSLVVVDDYRTKNKLGIPCAGKRDPKYLGDPCKHWEVWRQKWGWDWGARFKSEIPNQFLMHKARYYGTLTEELRRWKIEDGPKTLKDIEPWQENIV